MKYRLCCTLHLAMLIAALGCGSSQPPLPPTTVAQPSSASDTKPASAHASAESAPAATAPTSAQVKPAPTPAASQPAANLRDLAGRYVESDGAGGLRPNEKAALELEKLGPEAAAALWPLLADKQIEVRRGAAFYLLGSFNPNEPANVTAFSALLDDADRTIRGIGLSAARQMRSEDQTAAVPRLAAMLDPVREDRPQNRESVARLLAGLKSGAAASLDKLAAAATGDPVAQVRSACLIAIAQVAEADQAGPMVAKGLKDQDAAVRLVSAVRLRQLGATAAPASTEIAAALGDGDSRVRAAAAEALVKIGKPAVAEIADQLATDNLDARKLALYCLINIGPAAKDAAPQVEKCLADGDAEVKQLAAVALASIRGK